MKKNGSFCACKKPAYSDDEIKTADEHQRPVVYLACAQCGRAITGTGSVTDLSGERIAETEFQFAALPPTYRTAINPWSRKDFSEQSGGINSYPKDCPAWLVAKREQCLDDLAGLQSLLDGIRGNQRERQEAYESAFDQISGAYKQIGRIEQLIENVCPGFDLLTLPAAPDRYEFVRRARAFQTARPSYYAEALSHAA